jgi:anaerobic magnesium-protoporphyrin IX monomethyl ester cyclase
MKILLISPPSYNIVRRVIGIAAPPLNLAYLASMVRANHEVHIIDSVVENYSMQDVIQRVRHTNPDLIGITGTTTMMPDIYELAKLCKGYNKDMQIVVGGHHVTFLPEWTLQECPDLNYIIRGEGEQTFAELADALETTGELSGIKGLTYRHKNTIKSNPTREFINDVDSLPLPSYDLLPMDKYRVKDIGFGTIFTSRGCPFKCVFCSSSMQLGHHWRGHSVERIMKELTILNETYGKHEIEFLDDTFTFSQKRILELEERIRQEKLDISWVASSRVDTFSNDIAQAMKRSGAHTVYFGIESGSEKILNFIGKGITLDRALQAIATAKKVGLETLGSFVLGFPDENRDDVKKTVHFSKKIGVDFAQFTIATPYPGTSLWTYALKEKLLTTFDWQKYSSLKSVMRLKNFSATAIEKILRTAYLQFYLRPSILIKDLVRNNGFIFSRAIRSLLPRPDA